jgi:ribonucleoside-diphosphate reductase subunit M1
MIVDRICCFVMEQENANKAEDDVNSDMAQAACSLQNREECMACGS